MPIRQSGALTSDSPGPRPGGPTALRNVRPELKPVHMKQLAWPLTAGQGAWSTQTRFSVRNFSGPLRRACELVWRLARRTPRPGGALAEPQARDHPARDFKRHLKLDRGWRPASVNLALAAVDHFTASWGSGQPTSSASRWRRRRHARCRSTSNGRCCALHPAASTRPTTPLITCDHPPCCVDPCSSNPPTVCEPSGSCHSIVVLQANDARDSRLLPRDRASAQSVEA